MCLFNSITHFPLLHFPLLLTFVLHFSSLAVFTIVKLFRPIYGSPCAIQILIGQCLKMEAIAINEINSIRNARSRFRVENIILKIVCTRWLHGHDFFAPFLYFLRKWRKGAA